MKNSATRITALVYALLGLSILACNMIQAPADTYWDPGDNNGALFEQTQAEAERKSAGCLSCHEGIEPMHESKAVKLGCPDCHGGDGAHLLAKAAAIDSPEGERIKNLAHVLPRYPDRWRGKDGKYSSANPEQSYTLLNIEAPEFVRFVNPGDLRVAQRNCGGCHQQQVNAVRKSTMTTTAIFWAAAAYANGIVSVKNAILGESYLPGGAAAMIKPVTPPTDEEKQQGALSVLLPLPQWAILQPGDNFRVFEDGGLVQPSAFPEIGNPNPLEEPGKPDARLSNRGPGTGLRISIPVLNLHKTRLNDPHLSFLGTNDHPGDYRSSGCTACHVIYANDRDEAHSGPYAKFGHLGKTVSQDRIFSENRKRRDESGHPIQHRFTRSIPTSQCIVCHMHQPNAFVNTYLGYNMWDYETDGGLLWPEKQKNPTERERRQSLDHNPEGAAARGNWTDPEFLARLTDLTKGKTEHTKFADYHGHGWVFKAVYKRDRHGNLLDDKGQPIDMSGPERLQKAVHLKDIHLEKGMHCVDCHFSLDNHGNGKLYGEYGNSIEIGCEDCHGTLESRSSLKTSGPMAPRKTNPMTGEREKGTELLLGTTPFGQPRFVWRGDKLYQRSTLYKDQEWPVKQVIDTINPDAPECRKTNPNRERECDYNEKSRLAKTIQKDNKSWGAASAPKDKLAHSNDRMTCYSCHSSWITSCFGCHLPQEANQRSAMNHFEGTMTRQYSSYNPQVVREDVYMLGINGTVKGNKVAPVRSSSALVLSSESASRSRIYIQQPPISAPGFSSQAFNPHVPHTVRSKETKGCTDCHISKNNDNNAWIAQLLTLGTNFVNFIGRFAWVAEGKEGFEAVAVTEWTEPQAVIGSYLHRLAYPDYYRKHVDRKIELEESHSHHGGGEVRSLVKRGEYLYVAQGPGGMEAYDIANVDNKDFSERIVSAPVSPLGQRTYVRSKYATAVALPTNMPIAPYRQTGKIPVNQEQPWHPIYHYAFFTDRYEGLILTNVDTLADRDPLNNFFTRALTYNPDGLLNGAETLTIAGNHVYVGCDQGLIVLDFNDPLKPKVVAKVASIKKPTSITVQFRYAFVTDSEGFKVIDVTEPASPKVAAHLPVQQAHNVYVARTYAYIAGGPQGLIIVDVERPELPKIVMRYNADGRLNDTRDVKIASTNVSLFAYVADGKNGLRVVQLTSPETVPGFLGFSPKPSPQLIATRRTKGPAVAIAKGLERDRAVDESGNQVSVYNRIGARPFTLEEMKRLYYLRDGKRYDVVDTPPGPAVGSAALAGLKNK